MDVKQIAFSLPSIITSIKEEDFSKSVNRQGESTFILNGDRVVVLGAIILKLSDQNYNIELWPWCSYTKEQYFAREIISENHFKIKGRLESGFVDIGEEVVLHYDGSNERAEHPRIEIVNPPLKLEKFILSGGRYEEVAGYLKDVISPAQ